MTGTDRTVAHLRLAAERAAAHHSARHAPRLARMRRFLGLRDGYAAVANTLAPSDPRAWRAVELRDAAAYRALAWCALADGDAQQARHHRRQSVAAHRAAMAIRIA